MIGPTKKVMDELIKRHREVVRICSTITNCYAYHSWHFRVKPTTETDDLYDDFARAAVGSATLISSLIMLRTMHGFLAGQVRTDDLLCSDFGLNQQALLTDNELFDINKRVAHLTTANEHDKKLTRNLLIMYRRVYPIFKIVLQELAAKYGKDKNPSGLEIDHTYHFMGSLQEEMETAVLTHKV